MTTKALTDLVPVVVTAGVVSKVSNDFLGGSRARYQGHRGHGTKRQPMVLTDKDVRIILLPHQLDEASKLAARFGGVNSDLEKISKTRIAGIYSFGKVKDATKFRKEVSKLTEK